MYLPLTLVPGKITEKIIAGVIEKHQKDNAVTGHSQHGFTRGKPYLTNLISFYDQVTHLADQGKSVAVFFSSSFEMQEIYSKPYIFKWQQVLN